MEAVFLKLLNMSITAGWLVLAVIVLRLLLKKAPKAITILMWALVGIRLICPFSFESPYSLLPSGEPIPEHVLFGESSQIPNANASNDSVINPAFPESIHSAAAASESFMQTVSAAASVIWISGMAIMILYTFICYFRIYRRVREGVLLMENIWLCDRIAAPFIFGIIRPRIYLPSGMSTQDMEYVIAHEKAHLKRHDHWWKPLAFLLLTVYWFHPVLWIAYILLCRDIELACDERVIKNMSLDVRKAYSVTLINCSVPRKMIAACPLAFGETGVKGRIKMVLHYKKPAFWIMIVAVVACIGAAIGFLTNPAASKLYNHSEYDARDVQGIVVKSNEISRKITSPSSIDSVLAFLSEVEVKRLPVPEIRGKDREKSNVIAVHGNQISKYYYFSQDYSSVWVRDQDEAGATKIVLKPKQIQQFFADKLNASVGIVGGTEVSTWPTPESLKEKYPEYFNLSTSKGLEVYIWQMGEKSYYCGLRSGRNLVYSVEELLNLTPTSIEEMRIIVNSYQIPKEHVAIQPVNVPYSSYCYNINDDAYRARIEKLFWGETDTESQSANAWGLTMDVSFESAYEFHVAFRNDAQGIPAAGTLTTLPEYEIRAILHGETISFGDYMRNILGKNYRDTDFTWDSEIFTIHPGTDLTLHGDLRTTYGELPAGEYVLCKKVYLTAASGEVVPRVYSARFVVEE